MRNEDEEHLIPKFRMVILGIGGVGGYIGGKLAASYSHSPAMDIIFVTRKEDVDVIRSKGLHLTTPQREETVRPSLVTSDPGDIGSVDLLICCVKSYDLEQSLESFRDCLADDTIVLPLLNGVDICKRVMDMHLRAEVWEGCMYTVTRKKSPGVIQVSGKTSRIIFGCEGGSRKRLAQVKGIFSTAGLNSEISDNIKREMWEKFFLISPLATLTSFLDLPFGSILRNENHMMMLSTLQSEVKQVAAARGIPISGDAAAKTLDYLRTIPPEATSSMHDDIRNRKRTEIDSLTNYVIRCGKELNVPTPLYQEMARALSEKNVQ